MKMNTVCKLIIAVLVTLSVSCVAPPLTNTAVLYDVEGNPAAVVNKDDLNKADNQVTYRLRKDVWNTLGDLAVGTLSNVLEDKVNEIPRNRAVIVTPSK